MNYPHLATRLYNQPLLITPGKAEVIEQVFRAYAERPALLAPTPEPPAPRREFAAPGTVRTEGGYLRTGDGVAIISMYGTLVQRAGGMDAMSGLTGYNQIAAQLQAAVDDPRAYGILIEVDSPGGEANGAFDLQAKIAAANTKKPVWAIANEQAFSAAYLQASGAGKVLVPEPGMVGSIGVVMLHVDQSLRDAKQGIVYTAIFAGAHKVDFSSHAPISEDALAGAQMEVDRVYELFVNAVASGRGVDPQVVRDTEAGLLNPHDALALGLIDGVMGFDETVAALAAEGNHIRFYGTSAAGPARAQQHGDDWRDVMAQRATEQRALAANGIHSPEGANTMDPKDTTNAAATAAQLADAEARGVAKGKTDAGTDAAKTLAAAQTKAAADAQARISAILTHAESVGRRNLAEHLAFKTTQSVEDAAAMLAAAPKETAAAPANRFAQAMDAAGNPKIVPDAAASAGDASGDAVKATAPVAAKVYAFRKECVQKARGGR